MANEIKKLKKLSDMELAQKVMNGEFGNGPERQAALGKRYSAVQNIINNGMQEPETIELKLKETKKSPKVENANKNKISENASRRKDETQKTANRNEGINATTPNKKTDITANIMETEISKFKENSDSYSVSVPTSLHQTGIIPNQTNYVDYYGKWNINTAQRAISEKWHNSGRNSNRGIAMIDNRYLVAVAPKFGTTGDKINVKLDNGETIKCIIADVKGGDAQSEWGHVFGNSGVDIIEWESVVPRENIQIDDWHYHKVTEIVNKGKIV